MAYKFQEGLAKLDGVLSGSSNIIAKTSISGSGDLVVTGNIGCDGAFYGDGSGLSNISAGPGGSDTQVQYNNASSLGGDSAFTFNDSTKAVIFTGLISGSGGLQNRGASASFGGLLVSGGVSATGSITATTTVSGAALQGTAGTLTSLNVQLGGITNAGSIAGATTVAMGGALTGVTTATLSGKLSSSAGAEIVGNSVIVGTLKVTGAVTTAGAVTLGDGGDDTITVNGILELQAGMVGNVTGSGGNIDLSQAGAFFVVCTGSAAQTITLPDADSSVPDDGKMYVIKSAKSSGAISITGSSEGDAYDAYTIDGEASVTLESPYAALNIMWSADNGGWLVY